MQKLAFAGFVVALVSGCGGSDPINAKENTKAVSQAVTVSPPGVIRAFAGTGVRGGSPSGTPALQASLNSPSGLALCPDGGLYVSDTGNNRIVKISDGQMTTVVASQTAASGALYSNLLNNPRAEAPLVDGATVPGWTIVSPAGGWTEVPWVASRPQPLDGEMYFRANPGATGEMYQDLSVQSYATEIAAGTQKFTFSAFVHSLSGDANPDTTQIIVEYRTVSQGLILSKFDSGPIANRGEWQLITDTRTVPKLTRRIRVRLISTRHTGSGNDAYYDGLFLRAEPPTTSGSTVAAGDTVLALPHGLSCNWQNTLYIADTYNSRVLALSWDRLTTTTVAGTGVLGFNGENGISWLTQLALPMDVSFARANDSQLFIADYLNHRIRSVDWSSPTHSSTVYGGGSLDMGLLSYPMAVSTVGEANSTASLYIADTSDNAILSAWPSGNCQRT
jgi:NHL repeat